VLGLAFDRHKVNRYWWTRSENLALRQATNDQS